MTDIFRLLAQFIAVIFVLTMHEFSHAYAAYKCGDPTAKWSGRMTLNPLSHFDPVGLVAFLFVGFGWAKPVPINPSNFKNYKRGCFWTAIAGVLCNFLFALIIYPVWHSVFQRYALSGGAKTYGLYFVYYLFEYLYFFSLNFCAFNLLPLYPLDGFRVVEALDKKHGKVYRFLREKGQMILLCLLALSMLSNFLYGRTGNALFENINILELVMGKLTDWISKPIGWIWCWL